MKVSVRWRSREWDEYRKVEKSKMEGAQKLKLGIECTSGRATSGHETLVHFAKDLFGKLEHAMEHEMMLQDRNL